METASLFRLKASPAFRIVLQDQRRPKNRSAPAIVVAIELRIVVVVPTELIRLAIWSAGSESVRAKPTTL
jgi:hypothetical protein